MTTFTFPTTLFFVNVTESVTLRDNGKPQFSVAVPVEDLPKDLVSLFPGEVRSAADTKWRLFTLRSPIRPPVFGQEADGSDMLSARRFCEAVGLPFDTMPARAKAEVRTETFEKTFEKTAATGKSESAFVGVDFSDIERRVMAAMHVPDKMVRHASVSGRQHSKRATLEPRVRDALLEAIARVYVQAALEMMQTQIDEEGCGPVFAALKDWKE